MISILLKKKNPQTWPPQNIAKGGGWVDTATSKKKLNFF